MTNGESGTICLPAGVERQPDVLYHHCARDPADRAYEHGVAGSNFRMSKLHSGGHRCHSTRLDGRIERRERNVGVFADWADRIVDQTRRGHSTRVPRNMLMLRFLGSNAEGRCRDRAEYARQLGIPTFHNFWPLYWLDGLAGGIPGWDQRVNSEQIWSDGSWLHHRVLLADPMLVAELVHLVAEVDMAGRD
jgi:3-amino-5-hydroxybenzoate synthase